MTVVRGGARTPTTYRTALYDNNNVPITTYNKELRTLNQSYLQCISEGFVANHYAWSKIGYTPSVVAATESDIWSAGGVYSFPTAASGMEVVSSSATQDIGTVIKGAMNNTVQSDAGGSTITLVDADVDFTAATAVQVGDCVLLDPHGTSPEFGYVTGVATHTLTFAGGFSSGGSGSTRYYAVVDQSNAANTGAQAVRIEYLDSAYAQKSELVVVNGTTAVATINTDIFRIQSFRVIAAGTTYKTVGNLTLRKVSAGATYSYITALFTRSRNIQYTIPAGYSLYVTSLTSSYAYSHNSTHYARIYTRANYNAGINTGSIFYPFTEVICSNQTFYRGLEEPTKLPAKTDIKVSVLADYAGIATVALRGWLETE